MKQKPLQDKAEPLQDEAAEDHVEVDPYDSDGCFVGELKPVGTDMLVDVPVTRKKQVLKVPNILKLNQNWK